MTEVHISNTPVFDQLCQDFASIGIHFERLIAGGPIHLRPTRGFTPKLAIVDEQREEQTDDAVDAAMPQGLSSEEVADNVAHNLECFQAAAVRTLFEKNKME